MKAGFAISLILYALFMLLMPKVWLVILLCLLGALVLMGGFMWIVGPAIDEKLWEWGNDE